MAADIVLLTSAVPLFSAGEPLLLWDTALAGLLLALAAVLTGWMGALPELIGV